MKTIQTIIQSRGNGSRAVATVLVIWMTAVAMSAQDISAGLQILWKLDETNGLTAADASGNGRTGDLVSFAGDDTQWVPGKIGGGLYLTNSYVAVSGLPAINSTTWAAWVKLNTALNFGAVISATFPGANAGHSLGFNTGTTARNPRVVWNHDVGSTILMSPDAINLGEWTHLALAYDATAATLKLYVNGEQKAGTNGVRSTSFTSLNLGRRETSANSPLDGTLDEVRVYDRALSLLEIQQLAGKVVSGPPVFVQQPASKTVYEGQNAGFSVRVDGQVPFSYQWSRNGNPISGATDAALSLTQVLAAQAGDYTVTVTNASGTATSDKAVLTVITVTNIDTGLQARWKLDETTGLTASDATGNGNNGALVNFAEDYNQWIPGKDDKALLFNGANYMEAPDSPTIGTNLVAGFTVAAWFNSNVPLSTNGNTSRMFEKGDCIFLIQGNGDTNNVGIGGMDFAVKRNNTLLSASIGQALESNRWYHIAGTFDGQNIRVYLDGELKGTRLVGGDIDDDKLPLRIGSDDSGKFFNGAMDEISIWERPLSDSEVMNLTGRNLPTPPSMTKQPQPASPFAGATASFSIEVKGQEPFRYQWSKDNQDIRGATEATLTLFDVQAADAGNYRVKISNALGETLSDPVALTVNPIVNIQTGMNAWWKFDESSGLTAADASGHQNPGQLMDYADDNSQWVAGQSGRALFFDGQAHRVSVLHTDSLNLGTEASFAFWLKPATYGSERSAGVYNLSEGRILVKGAQFDIYTVDNPGGVRQTIIANGVNAPQGSLQLNAWQHWAIVYRAGMVSFFKNGFLVGEPAPGTLGAASTTNLVLGNIEETLNTLRLYNGLMDEVGIWTRPLSEGELLQLAGKDAAGPPVVELGIQTLTKTEGTTAEFLVQATGKRPISYQWFQNGQPTGANTNRLVLSGLTLAHAGSFSVKIQNDLGQVTNGPVQLVVNEIKDVTAGLLAYWDFDETTGDTLRDASGNGHTATLQNGTALPGIAGIIGGAFDFDGMDDFAIVPHSEQLNVADQATISVWVNPRTHSTIGDLGRIVKKSINYDLTLSTAGQNLRFYGNNKIAYDSPTNSVEINVWQHWAVVVKNGTIQFFKNGRSLGVPVPCQLGAANTDPLIIANFQADLIINRPFNGLMDELGVWNRALSPQEIDGIYENSLMGKGLSTKFEPLNIRALALVSQDQAKLTFFTPYANRTYAVEQADDLAGQQWHKVTNAQISNIGQGLMDAAFAHTAGVATYYRVMRQPLPPIFAEDFESGAAGWTHGGVQDNWTLGKPAKGPGQAVSGVNVYATGLSGNVMEFTDSYLHSPIIDLTNAKAATLAFKEWLNIDVQVSFQGTVVNVLDADTQAVIQEVSRLAGASAGWQARTFALGSQCLGRRIMLEFRLYTDNFNLLEGWLLDDVAVSPE